jgi:hypothetical protein
VQLLNLNMTRRKLLQWLGALGAYSAMAPKSASQSGDDFTLHAQAREISISGLSIELSESAEIVALKLGPNRRSIPFRASTLLAACTQQGKTVRRDLESGGLEFTRIFIQDGTRSACTVFDRFTPMKSSIRWDVEIVGPADPWSTQIETKLSWLDSSRASFWTAWDSPPAQDNAERSRLMDAWNDPLVPAPFTDMDLRYGGFLESHHAFCIPIATIMDESVDIALSLVQSPETDLLDISLTTSTLGDVKLARTNHRISSRTPVRISMDLVSHPADWRGGLGWMVDRYPHYFESPNPHAYELDGTGSYAGNDGDLDIGRLKKMAYSLNWNARFDFPYLGMSIPPVKSDVTWPSWYQKPASLAQMSKYDEQMQQSGFHVLEYFNTTEGGNYIQDDPPPRKTGNDAELWRDGNDFIHYQVPDAVVRDRSGKILYSNWFKNVVLDSADPAWQKSLLQQAETLVKELPHSSGICIDRMDWLATYNVNRDDGLSWVDGRPARSLITSWKQTLKKLAAILHPAGKFIYANTLIARVDCCEWLDGFYDEYGDVPSSFNLVAFLAVHKPAIAWTRTIDTLRPNPDAFFQRHLHMGVFPTVPMPGADHSIAEDPWVDQYYLDYGPLLAAIRGKQHVLKSHVISVNGHAAHVNLFKVEGGYAIPITFADHVSEVTVTLRDLLEESEHIASITALFPGVAEASALTWHSEGHEVTITVGVQRDCALMKIGMSRPSAS